MHNKGQHGLGDLNVTNKHTKKKTKLITFLYLNIYTNKQISQLYYMFSIVNVLVKLYLEINTHGLGINT
jgi:hypothetical protein